ncbi:MAG: DegT/DnrJ/EryC1/StrS family aminotransferase, partial [Candidatus Sericytochromatia bacterium]
TIGHLGTYSFHETKNYTSGGEGGLLIINDDKFIERAEIIREKGTNRSKFLRGMVDKYTWVDIGSSYLMNEVSAAFLWGNLEMIGNVNNRRLAIWRKYYISLSDLQKEGYIDLPTVPEECVHNAHMFYIKVKDLDERTRLMSYLRGKGITAAFHYVPLHSSPAGRIYGRFSGQDVYTTKESERLLRLPIFYAMKDEQVEIVVEAIYSFYKYQKGR